MKVRYDPDANAVMITLREAQVVESDEVGPGVIADFAADGQIVGIEILHATHQIENPAKIQFSVTVAP